MVAIDVNVRSPLRHHLGDVGVDLLRLELEVVPIHVVPGLVGAPVRLPSIRVGERRADDDDVLQDVPEISRDQLPRNQLKGLLGRDLVSVDGGSHEDDGLAGPDGVLGVHDRVFGDHDEVHLPPHDGLGERLHAHQFAHGIELVPELHERLEWGGPRAETLPFLPGLGKLLRGEGTDPRNREQGEKGGNRKKGVGEPESASDVRHDRRGLKAHT
jgi:hypothetical protein